MQAKAGVLRYGVTSPLLFFMTIMRSSRRQIDSARIAFWLVPATPDRLRLEKIIRCLADSYNSPCFMPHVTLWSTQLTKGESAQQILETAAESFAPCSLDAIDLDHGPDRFKSVFIRFKSGPLLALSNALGSACRTPGNYCLDAHLSLLYCQLKRQAREKILAELDLPQYRIYFDTLIATTPGPDQTDFDDVNRWQHIAELRLQAS